MTEVAEASTWSASELLAAGRRHLAVKDFTSAVETLANACELLAKEHGDTADQCAEAYLWYAKALLGLSREESGVLGDGMPGTGNADEEDDNDDQEENGETAEEDQNGEAETVTENGEGTTSAVEKSEAQSTTPEEPGSSKANEEPESSTNNDAELGTTNIDEDGDGDADVSMMNADENADEDVDNLQLAWEMLELSRSILLRRVEKGGGTAARSLLSDVHLTLGEVALESETYDKAVIDMQSCLELQKDLYGPDDRRIAETHYQIGLANSLASNFEDAITHFKNAANILESRIKSLENPTSSSDVAVKKHFTADTHNSVEAEIKELKELLPEIQEKIQDMMDYKAETIKRVRESLLPSNGAGSSNGASSSSAFSPSSISSTASKPAASDISHLIKRKRKASEEADTAAKRVNT